MPFSINWLDITILVILTLSLIQGIRVGLIRSAFSIAGIVIGLFFAISLYSSGSEFLLNLVNMPPFFADAISFVFIFSCFSVAIHLLGSLFSVITRISLIKMVDKAGGSAAGLIIGIAIIGILLILLTAFPVYGGFQAQVEHSYLAPQIVDCTIFAYEEIASLFSLKLPRIIAHPESMSDLLSYTDRLEDHYGVDFKGLDNATCFVCDGKVTFLGYIGNSKNTTSPKFTCNDCGRTSDGCQTYEGYHQMYHQCPVELGNQGYRFDCGIWTNYTYHRPIGPCPVCGIE